jgi:hypothetical protein
MNPKGTTVQVVNKYPQFPVQIHLPLAFASSCSLFLDFSSSTMMEWTQVQTNLTSKEALCLFPLQIICKMTKDHAQVKHNIFQFWPFVP